MAKFYANKHDLHYKSGDHVCSFEIVDEDTFTTAASLKNPCCLNFASHKRPGGGYESVIDLPMPIKTQEEDLFRRSNLPELMDNDKVREKYPLRGMEAFYCVAKVVKDKCLNPIEPFDVGVVTMPAVVNPSRKDKDLVERKIKRILEISAANGHTDLVLGAWGCGIFRNDPKEIATLFVKNLNGKFRGVFENVVFAVPGVGSHNYNAFKNAMP